MCWRTANPCAYRLTAASVLLVASYPPAAIPALALVALVPLVAEAADDTVAPWRRTLGILAVTTLVGVLKFGWLAGALGGTIGADPAIAAAVVGAYLLAVAGAYTAALMLPYRLSGGYRFAAQGALLAAVAIAVPWPMPLSWAHAAIDLPWLPLLAALGGVAAVDLAVIAVNLLVAAAMLGCRRQACLFALVAGGTLLVMAPPAATAPPDAPAATLRVAVIQPAVPSFRRLRIDPEYRDEHRRRTLAMARAAAASDPPPDLIVLPEYPSLFAYIGSAHDNRLIEDLARATGAPILLTAFRGLGAGGVTSTSILVHGDGSFAMTDKQVLFPFGEYLPGERMLPALRHAFPLAGRLAPGGAPLALPMPGRDIAIAVLMCFDDTMSGPAGRIFAQVPLARPMLAVSLVNDESFGDRRAHELHLLMTRYRAIEAGQPLLRVANDGHSGVIGTDGRMREADRLPPHEARWAILTVPAGARSPIAAGAIDSALRWATMFAGIAALAGCALAGRRARGGAR
jgi:apolipoprotein N-acyltransferase